MKKLAFILVVTGLVWPSWRTHAEEATLPGGTCLSCHLDLEDQSATLWKDDVHAKAGIGCADCHGGDSKQDDMDKAKAKSTGFKGAPKKSDIPALCAKCHSDANFMKKYSPLLPVDQLQKYKTSVHGEKLLKGDKKVAQCVSCHQAHGIMKVNDSRSPVYASNLPKMCSHCHADKEYMAEYKIPTDQYDDYIQSVHGKALLEKGDVRGAPACNDCHGNHGASPPEVHNIANICGTCHAHNAELFLKSPMAKPLLDRPLAECMACHGKHKIMHTSDDLVSDKDSSVCMQCHKPREKGTEFAAYVASSIAELRGGTKTAADLLEQGRTKGLDVGEGMDELEASRQALMQVRTELHAFSKPIVETKFEEGRKALEKAKNFGLAAIKESQFRRIGLAVSSVLLTFVIIGLALLIRSLPPPRK